MAQRHGTAQLGAEKAEGYLINMYKYLMKGVKKAVRLFSVQTIPFQNLSQQGSQTLEQVAQRGCQISIFGSSKSG